MNAKRLAIIVAISIVLGAAITLFTGYFITYAVGQCPSLGKCPGSGYHIYGALLPWRYIEFDYVSVNGIQSNSIVFGYYQFELDTLLWFIVVLVILIAIDAFLIVIGSLVHRNRPTQRMRGRSK